MPGMDFAQGQAFKAKLDALDKGATLPVWLTEKKGEFEPGQQMLAKSAQVFNGKTPMVVVTVTPPIEGAKSISVPSTLLTETAPGEEGGSDEENPYAETPVWQALVAFLPDCQLAQDLLGAFVSTFIGDNECAWFDEDTLAPLQHAANAASLMLDNVLTENQIGVLYSTLAEECAAVEKSPALLEWQEKMIAASKAAEAQKAKPTTKGKGSTKATAEKTAAAPSVTPQQLSGDVTDVVMRLAGHILIEAGTCGDSIDTIVAEALAKAKAAVNA